MRFLVDECTGPAVSQWLRSRQHDVFSIYEESRGVNDEVILQKAVTEDRILITNDKDFGEMVFREGKPQKGIVLLRLEHDRAFNKIKVLKQLLEQYADQLAENFVVVTETTVRIVHLRG